MGDTHTCPACNRTFDKVDTDADPDQLVPVRSPLGVQPLRPSDRPIRTDDASANHQLRPESRGLHPGHGTGVAGAPAVAVASDVAGRQGRERPFGMLKAFAPLRDSLMISEKQMLSDCSHV